MYNKICLNWINGMFPIIVHSSLLLLIREQPDYNISKCPLCHHTLQWPVSQLLVYTAEDTIKARSHHTATSVDTIIHLDLCSLYPEFQTLP